MWWKFLAVSVCCLFSSVLSAETNGKPFLQIMVKSTVYNVGDKRAIYCKGENLENDIEWYSPQNHVVEPRSPQNTRFFVEKPRDPMLAKSLVPLIIQSAKTEDNGNWTCKSGQLEEVIDILVGEKATIVSFKRMVEVKESQNVVLNCHAKGYPPPAIQWLRDMKPIEDDSNPTKFILKADEGNLRLTIKNLSYSDAGEYICKATQKVLSYFTAETLLLNVKHKPVMEHSKAQEVYAIINETKKITCNAIANPQPEYFWYRRRNNYDYKLEEITAEDSISTAEDGSNSVLEIHMKNESYLGEYVCTATNLHGRESVVFHVSLGNKPEPPDFVTCIHASASELVFNVTCSTCNMHSEENVVPQPNNLTILGFSFELVPTKPEYSIPDWDDATEILVDVVDPKNTTFTVGPLNNSTTYYVRVRTRNAAGYSTWFELSDNPTTTAYATALIASIALLISSLVFTQLY